LPARFPLQHTAAAAAGVTAQQTAAAAAAAAIAAAAAGDRVVQPPVSVNNALGTALCNSRCPDLIAVSRRIW
jgi:hypothetical protein